MNVKYRWRWCKVVEDRSPLLSNVPQTRRRLQRNKTFKSLSKLIMNSILRPGPPLCGWVSNQQQKVKRHISVAQRQEAGSIGLCNWMDMTSSKGYFYQAHFNFSTDNELESGGRATNFWIANNKFSYRFHCSSSTRWTSFEKKLLQKELQSFHMLNAIAEMSK